MTARQDWREVRLGELIESMKNGLYKPSNAYADDGYACLRMYNIDDGKIVWRKIKRMRLSDAEFQDYRLDPGDLLVNRVNSRELVGKTAVIPSGLEPTVFESKNIRVRLKRNIANSRFVCYALLLKGQSHFDRNAQQVVGMASISQKQIADFRLLCPPLDEQHSIVAEIEERLSRLEAGVAALKRVQANLKRYRASVLSAAILGDMGDPGGAEGWAQTEIQALAAKEPNAITDGPFGSKLKTAHYTSSGPRVIRLQNIGDGFFVDEKAHISEDHFASLSKHRVFPGDLVIAGLGEILPRVCMIPDGIGPAIVKADCIRFKAGGSVLPKFLMYALNADRTRRATKERMHGVGRPRLNLGEIKSIVVPVPPLERQRKIVAEVDRRLSVVEELETQVIADLARATRLRQATLESAFRQSGSTYSAS